MKEKIKFIKLILSTILLIILLMSIFKSCSYANTFEEFEDYVNFVVNGKVGATNSLKTACNYFNTNKNSIKNAVNVQEYNSFVLINGDNCYFEMYTGTTNATLTGNVLRTKNFTTAYSFKINNNSIVSQKSGSYLNSISYYGYNSMGLVTGTFPSDLVYNSKYVSLNILNYPNYEPTIPYRIAQAFIGNHYDNITFTLQDVNNTDIDTGLMLQYFSGDSGTNYDIFLTNVDNVTNGGYYHIKMTYGGYFITSKDFEIKWHVDLPPNVGEITNNSGEVTGNINLQPIQDSLNNIDNSINQQGENITNAIIQAESGEKERQSFWENVYNTMFIPSGDKIETKINELKEHIGISGDISGELLILESIKNNSGDFIIKWDTMSTHFSINGNQLQNQLTIPSGEINFSKIERENEAFQNTMEWVRVILGFSLIVLIIKQWWTLVLKTLGISTEVYEQHREEQERLNQAQAKAEEKEKRIIARQLFNSNQERLREYNKLAKKKGWRK